MEPFPSSPPARDFAQAFLLPAMRTPLTPCCWLPLRLQVSIIISLPTPLAPESVSNSESYSQTPIPGLDICCGASHRSASPVVVQPRDQRNSLETATETGVVYWTGESYQGSWSDNSTQPVDRTWQQPLLLRGGGGYHTQGELMSVARD